MNNEELYYMQLKYYNLAGEIHDTVCEITEDRYRTICGEFLGGSAVKKTKEELIREKDRVFIQIFKMASFGAMLTEIQDMIMYYRCLCDAEVWRIDLTKARKGLHVIELFEKYSCDFDEDFA